MTRVRVSWHGFLAAAVLCLLPAVAQAATITPFNSRAAFLGAIGPSQTFDFNQPDGPISLLDGLASISTVGGDANGRVLSNALCGSSGGGVNCFPPVSFTLAGGERAFGY